MGDRLLDFTGQSVLITGASTGIGRAVALAFARQGGKIAIGDADPRAQETVDLIVAQGGTAFYRAWWPTPAWHPTSHPSMV